MSSSFESELRSERLDSVKLETRGVTQQKQGAFWRSQTIHKNTLAAKLRSVGASGIALKLELCHTRTTIMQCKSCADIQTFANRCDQLFCPECQPRLARERQKSIQWWANEMRDPKHVVLTVKNTKDFTSGHIKEFRRWFTALRRRKFCKNWIGGFYSLEVTNEGNGWHLHLHALVEAGFIDKFRLSEEWAKVTGGYGRIVDVKCARKKDYLREVTKYAVKGVQLAAWTGQQSLEFITALKHQRTFGVFGSLYSLRTKWREWIAGLLKHGNVCKCGCSEFHFCDEQDWLVRQLVRENQASIPPPAVPLSLQPVFTI